MGLSVERTPFPQRRGVSSWHPALPVCSGEQTSLAAPYASSVSIDSTLIETLLGIDRSQGVRGIRQKGPENMADLSRHYSPGSVFRVLQSRSTEYSTSLSEDYYSEGCRLRNLDLTGQKQVFKAENNPWVTPIADQFQLGVSHVFEYIRSETYKYDLRVLSTPSEASESRAVTGREDGLSDFQALMGSKRRYGRLKQNSEVSV
ncbi:Ras suppressor protein 1 [Pteropus alecto]|uniref:Ras suppressor protein 1 n=1 Tax=Pteropus alecto TaxID=9402 RepID=L5L003_PTEAL|nr:Ras suppressor protein 1 [Pteropus alecto]